MAGFSSDVQADSPIGYRSRVLMGNGPVSYNGFEFPPALHSGVTVVPEYDENDRALKYITVAVQIEFIYTAPDYDAYMPTGPNDDSQIENSFRTNIPILVKRLSEPGQALRFVSQGFGDFTVNAGSVYDVDWGPKPQVTEWEPLGGGNAARIQWLCTARISPCQSLQPDDIIGYGYEMNWSLDRAGFMTREITGFVIIPHTRGPGGGGQANTLISLRTWRALAKLKESNKKFFPLNRNFERSYSYAVSKNKSRIDFTITDVEIHTDESLPPGAISCNITRSISSDLENGFTNWVLSIGGSIEVVNAKKTGFGVQFTKIIVWLYLLKILKTIRNRFESVIASNVVKDGNEALKSAINAELNGTEDDESPTFYPVNKLSPGTDSYGNNEKKSYEESITFYPVSISVSDEIFSNALSFSIVYNAVVSSDLIMFASGMFQPLDVQGADTSTWVRYLEDSGVYDDTLDPSIRQYEIIVDLCNPLQEQSVTEKVKPLPQVLLDRYKQSSHDFKSTADIADPKKSWIHYENNISFYSSSGTVIGQKISEWNLNKVDKVYKNADGKEGDPGLAFGGAHPWAGFNGGSSSQIKNQEQLTILRNRQDICLVCMRGMAVRYGKNVMAPKLIGIGKGLKYNYQTGEVTYSETDPATGKTVLESDRGAIAYPLEPRIVNKRVIPAFVQDKKFKTEITWELWYVLDRIPKTGEVITTGNPIRVRQ